MAGAIETASTGAQEQRGEGAYARLREAEERFRLAFEHAPIGIALVSLDGSFTRVNRALANPRCRQGVQRRADSPLRGRRRDVEVTAGFARYVASGARWRCEARARGWPEPVDRRD